MFQQLKHHAGKLLNVTVLQPARSCLSEGEEKTVERLGGRRDGLGGENGGGEKREGRYWRGEERWAGGLVEERNSVFDG